MKLRLVLWLAVFFAACSPLSACGTVPKAQPAQGPAQAETKDTMLALLDARCAWHSMEDKMGEPCLILAYRAPDGTFYYRMVLGSRTRMVGSRAPSISPVMAVAPPGKIGDEVFYAHFPVTGPDDPLTGMLYDPKKIYNYTVKIGDVSVRLELIMIRGCLKEDLVRARMQVDPNRINDEFQEAFCKDELHSAQNLAGVE